MLPCRRWSSAKAAAMQEHRGRHRSVPLPTGGSEPQEQPQHTAPTRALGGSGVAYLLGAHEHVVQDAALPLVVLARRVPAVLQPGSVQWPPPAIYLYQARTHARIGRLRPGKGAGRARRWVCSLVTSAVQRGQMHLAAK